MAKTGSHVDQHGVHKPWVVRFETTACELPTKIERKRSTVSRSFEPPKPPKRYRTITVASMSGGYRRSPTTGVEIREIFVREQRVAVLVEQPIDRIIGQKIVTKVPARIEEAQRVWSASLRHHGSLQNLHSKRSQAHDAVDPLRAKKHQPPSTPDRNMPCLHTSMAVLPSRCYADLPRPRNSGGW